MPSKSAVAPALVQSYLETEYHIHGIRPAVLRVDLTCPELASVHHDAQLMVRKFKTGNALLSVRMGPDFLPTLGRTRPGWSAGLAVSALTVNLGVSIA